MTMFNTKDSKAYMKSENTVNFEKIGDKVILSNGKNIALVK